MAAYLLVPFSVSDMLLQSCGKYHKTPKPAAKPISTILGYVNRFVKVYILKTVKMYVFFILWSITPFNIGGTPHFSP